MTSGYVMAWVFTHHSALLSMQSSCIGRTFLPLFFSAFIITIYFFKCSQAELNFTMGSTISHFSSFSVASLLPFWWRVLPNIVSMSLIGRLPSYSYVLLSRGTAASLRVHLFPLILSVRLGQLQAIPLANGSGHPG